MLIMWYLKKPTFCSRIGLSCLNIISRSDTNIYIIIFNIISIRHQIQTFLLDMKLDFNLKAYIQFSLTLFSIHPLNFVKPLRPLWMFWCGYEITQAFNFIEHDPTFIKYFQDNNFKRIYKYPGLSSSETFMALFHQV